MLKESDKNLVFVKKLIFILTILEELLIAAYGISCLAALPKSPRGIDVVLLILLIGVCMFMVYVKYKIYMCVISFFADVKNIRNKLNADEDKTKEMMNELFYE